MPSIEHESLLLLFRNQPELAVQLLREALHVELPAYTEARLASSDLTEIVPTEFRADAVILLVNDRPVLGVIVEAQLSRVDRKRFTWPAYAAILRARHECPVELLIITPDPIVASWAAHTIPLDLSGSSFVRPRVLGPDAIPIITDPEQAARSPELAILSVMAHGKGDLERAVQVALAANAGVAHISDRELFVLYSDLIETALSEAARKALQMLPQGYEYKSESIKKAIEQGREQGLEQGREQGLEQGREQGLERGRSESRAAAVLEVLDARGLTINAEQRERILTCTDLDRLTAWLRHAVTVASTDKLFE